MKKPNSSSSSYGRNSSQQTCSFWSGLQLTEHRCEWVCEDRAHQFAKDNNLRSLYDYHTDHSDVSICWYRKPKATLREDYAYPLCGSPHNLPVDLHLLRFCHSNDIAFDLITDHDLDRLGMDGLNGYSAVFFGQPSGILVCRRRNEFAYIPAQRWNLVYLGGKGFAAAVAFKDDLMELRRSPLEAGRTCDGEISESVFSINNRPSGFLRIQGKGEYHLMGVGISLMGFGDATNASLGTKDDCQVLARSEDFPDDFFHDPTRWYEASEAERDALRCAEMTIRYLPSGSFIFSASSAAWCGALPSQHS